MREGRLVAKYWPRYLLVLSQMMQ